jgi:drug/metabolite transporter (DMT)-like permease
MESGMRMDKLLLLAFILVGVAIISGAIAQISLKRGVENLKDKYEINQLLNPINFAKALFTSPLLLIGLMLYIIGFVVWIAALTKLDVSFMYPMLALAYVLVAVLAAVFLKEEITLLRWTGIALVTIGAILLLKTA